MVGGLKQLHSLETLALHCNQLTELAEIGTECRYMNCLKYLSKIFHFTVKTVYNWIILNHDFN